jgi:DNA-binding NarL/FixJ family response regulator
MRILVADDNDLVRRGVLQILSCEKDWEVCGEAKNGAEAVEKAREVLPDLILLDISMPGMGGLEATRQIRQEVPQTKILIMSQHDMAQLSTRIVRAGAHGCVDKNRIGTDLLAAIRSLAGMPEVHPIEKDK